MQDLTLLFRRSRDVSERTRVLSRLLGTMAEGKQALTSPTPSWRSSSQRPLRKAQDLETVSILRPHVSPQVFLSTQHLEVVERSNGLWGNSFNPDNLEQGASLVAQIVKNLPAVQKTWAPSLDQGRFPGEGNSNPPQYSCLENPMDREAWWTIVHSVAKSRVQISK